MNLALYTRILYRHRLVLMIGVAVALFLAVASYYKIPSMTPRKAEVWQSQANLFITEPGFAAGSRSAYNNAGRFVGLASLYARLAESDQVLARIEKNGRLEGVFQAVALFDSAAGQAPLPMVGLFGKATSPGAATTTLNRGLEAFIGYVRDQQKTAGIPEKQRIELRLINAPDEPIIIEPRKKTLPVVVFLAVMIAAIALVLILENTARARAMQAGEPTPEIDSAAIEPEPNLAASVPAPAPAPAAAAAPELRPDPTPAPLPARATELRTETEPRPTRAPELQAEPEPDEPELVRVRRWA